MQSLRENNQYAGDDEEDEALEKRDEKINGVRMIGKDNNGGVDGDDDNDDDEEEEEAEDTDDDEEDEDDDCARPRKKRKLKNLISNYEFAPRVPAPTPMLQAAPSSRAASGGRNSGVDWNEHETLALVDAWGERFLKLGRKSLRSEEWQEVSERVSQETSIERTDTQCRNRLDTLKKRYRREKARLEASLGGGGGSKWALYRKMDMMLNPPLEQRQASLSCGVDSGEYVFMDPKVYLNRANGLDEMRDSPGNSESLRGDGEDDSDGFPPNKKRNRHKRVHSSSVESSSFRFLADSIQKFSEIYEKIEVNKRKQMMELENMRTDFHRQLETQRRQILERAQAEIAKIRQGDNDGDDDDDGNDLSADD